MEDIKINAEVEKDEKDKNIIKESLETNLKDLTVSLNASQTIDNNKIDDKEVGVSVKFNF